jgi:thiol-disulfide isomerase/thioredoxin
MRRISILFIIVFPFACLAQMQVGDRLLAIGGINTNSKLIIINDTTNLFLLDFWASNCRPCRRYANPWMRQMFLKYNEAGLQVCSISLDENSNSWQNALQKDSCVGTQIRLSNNWDNTAVIKYGVKSIPAKFLFYKGVLIMKEKSMSEMEEKIKEILSIEKVNK